MSPHDPKQSPRHRFNAFIEKIARPELGRFQAAVLSMLFACVWCVIGLLSGYLLSYLVVVMTSEGVDASGPATLIFNITLVVCSTYGIIRGFRLYRAFSDSLKP